MAILSFLIILKYEKYMGSFKLIRSSSMRNLRGGETAHVITLIVNLLAKIMFGTPSDRCIFPVWTKNLFAWAGHIAAGFRLNKLAVCGREISRTALSRRSPGKKQPRRKPNAAPVQSGNFLINSSLFLIFGASMSEGAEGMGRLPACPAHNMR